MKRRTFLSNLSKTALGAPILVNGMPLRALGESQFISQFLQNGFEDRILVLIQLQGGNDGVNTLVPIDQYSEYESLRTNIAIPNSGNRKYINLDATLPIAAQVGLHPDLTAFKDLYDNGKMSVVQGVGYENTNFSHFRSRDIWYMGGDYDEYKNSGWMGRYLDHVFPNYPSAYPTSAMPDPLGLEVGVKVSLGYYRDQGIPTALATPDPGNFANILSGLGGPNPDSVPGDHYGDELQHIIDLYANANDYAQQLQNRFNAGSNNGVYPIGATGQYPGAAPNQYLQNPLAPQLQTVARLINGGSKTKIYLVRIGGFDTHDSQVIANDPTHGIHGALLYHLSTAVKAFFDDLAVSGYDQEVMAMTYTDFGRRPHSNGSDGTDHGTSSPTFVFGKGVEPGIIGTSPSLTNLDSTGNLLVQHDYRQVITTLLCDWMGADTATLDAVDFTEYATQKLSLVDSTFATSAGDPLTGYALDMKLFPNPTRDHLEVKFSTPRMQDISLHVYNATGQQVLFRKLGKIQGDQQTRIEVSTLAQGMYILSLRGQGAKTLVSKRFVKQ